jgi:hypothetical protein
MGYIFNKKQGKRVGLGMCYLRFVLLCFSCSFDLGPACLQVAQGRKIDFWLAWKIKIARPRQAGLQEKKLS